jgi:hypothetical protein
MVLSPWNKVHFISVDLNERLSHAVFILLYIELFLKNCKIVMSLVNAIFLLLFRYWTSNARLVFHVYCNTIFSDNSVEL